MQLYSVKPTEVDKLAFGSQKHNLEKQYIKGDISLSSV